MGLAIGPSSCGYGGVLAREVVVAAQEAGTAAVAVLHVAQMHARHAQDFSRRRNGQLGFDLRFF